MPIALAPVIVTAPAAPCVSLAEAKAHLRVDHEDEDALISALVEAAIAHFDGWGGILGRALVTQVWRQAHSGFPLDGRIVLPLAPVQSVVVKYRDAANVEQTLSASLYSFVTEYIGPTVIFNPSGLPSLYDRPDALTIEFTAGYGEPDQVPFPIKAAILLLVGEIYKNRESSIAANVANNPIFDRLARPYRRVIF